MYIGLKLQGNALLMFEAIIKTNHAIKKNVGLVS